MPQDQNSIAVLYFSVGFFIAVLLGFVWILLGRRLNLYLVSDDSPINDQSLIPITEEHRPRTRREKIDIDLGDYSNHKYSYRFGFDPVLRFNLTLNAGESQSSLLNMKPMIVGKRYWLRDGMKLSTGDRYYKIRIASAQNEKLELSKEVKHEFD